MRTKVLIIAAVLLLMLVMVTPVAAVQFGEKVGVVARPSETTHSRRSEANRESDRASSRTSASPVSPLSRMLWPTYVISSRSRAESNDSRKR